MQELGAVNHALRKCAAIVFAYEIAMVYIIQVSWSDGSTENIYRRYSKFFDLQDCCAHMGMIKQLATSSKGKYVIALFKPGMLAIKPQRPEIRLGHQARLQRSFYSNPAD
ncbi:UNVERIFIED_CONTAM: hypothetical protein FKN15_018737 [Acipenser sinensis]